MFAGVFIFNLLEAGETFEGVLEDDLDGEEGNSTRDTCVGSFERCGDGVIVFTFRKGEEGRGESNRTEFCFPEMRL